MEAAVALGREGEAVSDWVYFLPLVAVAVALWGGTLASWLWERRLK